MYVSDISFTFLTSLAKTVLVSEYESTRMDETRTSIGGRRVLSVNRSSVRMNVVLVAR